MSIKLNIAERLRLSIKQKLVALVVLCIFLLISTLLLGFFYYQRVNRVIKFREDLLGFVNNIEKIRVTEKQYLNNFTSELENKAEISIKEISEVLKIYRNSTLGRTWASRFNEIANGLTNYQNLFAEAVTNYQEKIALFKELEKPLERSNKTIDETISAINQIQFEKQMEGEYLNSDETGLSNTIRDAKIFFFQLNYLQQQYLLTGDAKYLSAFEKILKSKVQATLQAIDQFGKTIGDAQFLNVSSVINENTGIFLEISNKTKQNFEKHNATVAELDLQGNSIVVATNNLLQEASKAIKKIIRSAIISICVFLAIGVTVFLVIASSVVISILQPIDNLHKAIDEISSGDLVTEIKNKSNDELGKICMKLDGMRRNLHTMIKDILLGVQTLTSSSSELTSISKHMNGGLQQTSQDAQTVADSAETMCANMTAASDSMKGAANNVKTVAASTDQMNETISKIALNTDKAKNFTGDAVSQTTNVFTRVEELGAAAKKIDMVTETITTISEQTNLLALNATIEAARAGDAGKGFAVVATEIKELAKQTAKATEDIKSRIEGIQNSTKLTVVDIEKISGIIKEVHEIVTSISIAIEEQSTVCNEISHRVNDFSLGISQIDDNVSNSTDISRNITKEIAGVNKAAMDMTTSSNQIDRSVQGLSKLSNQLKDMVDRFKVG
jgi:methyl-accepting chemotaxis protein